MTDMEAILDKYADWLSQFDEEYESADFFKDLNTYSSIRAIIPTEWYTIHIIRGDYGDDGGPATLIAFMEPDFLHEEPTVSTLVQSFDTYTSVIFDRSHESEEL